MFIILRLLLLIYFSLCCCGGRGRGIWEVGGSGGWAGAVINNAWPLWHIPLYTRPHPPPYLPMSPISNLYLHISISCPPHTPCDSFIIYCLLLIDCYFLVTIYYLLVVIYYFFLVRYYLFFVIYSKRFAHSAVPTACEQAVLLVARRLRG